MSAEEEIDSMSVKELRSFITQAGLSFADCIEKSDLRARAREAARAKGGAGASGNAGGGGAQPPAPVGTTAGAVSTRTLGGYQCVVNAPIGDDPIDLLCVVLHGYGASNSDFAPFPELFAKMPQSELAGKRVGWVFPQAPPDAQGTPAWWQINPMEWMMAMQGGAEALAGLIRKEFNGMPECRRKMQSLIAEAEASFPKGSEAPLCMAGFSQGAMTAMDVSLSLPIDRVAGVMMLSGAPITVDAWQPKLAERKGKMQVLVTHGTADAVLPFAASGWLRDLLVGSLCVAVMPRHSLECCRTVRANTAIRACFVYLAVATPA
jgi:phospholipase/carboxylesterase